MVKLSQQIIQSQISESNLTRTQRLIQQQRESKQKREILTGLKSAQSKLSKTTSITEYRTEFDKLPIAIRQLFPTPQQLQQIQQHAIEKNVQDLKRLISKRANKLNVLRNKINSAKGRRKEILRERFDKVDAEIDALERSEDNIRKGASVNDALKFAIKRGEFQVRFSKQLKTVKQRRQISIQKSISQDPLIKDRISIWKKAGFSTFDANVLAEREFIENQNIGITEARRILREEKFTPAFPKSKKQLEQFKRPRKRLELTTIQKIPKLIIGSINKAISLLPSQLEARTTEGVDVATSKISIIGVNAAIKDMEKKGLTSNKVAEFNRKVEAFNEKVKSFNLNPTEKRRQELLKEAQSLDKEKQKFVNLRVELNQRIENIDERLPNIDIQLKDEGIKFIGRKGRDITDRVIESQSRARLKDLPFESLTNFERLIREQESNIGKFNALINKIKTPGTKISTPIFDIPITTLGIQTEIGKFITKTAFDIGATDVGVLARLGVDPKKQLKERTFETISAGLDVTLIGGGVAFKALKTPKVLRFEALVKGEEIAGVGKIGTQLSKILRKIPETDIGKIMKKTGVLNEQKLNQLIRKTEPEFIFKQKKIGEFAEISFGKGFQKLGKDSTELIRTMDKTIFKAVKKSGTFTIEKGLTLVDVPSTRRGLAASVSATIQNLEKAITKGRIVTPKGRLRKSLEQIGLRRESAGTIQFQGILRNIESIQASAMKTIQTFQTQRTQKIMRQITKDVLKSTDLSIGKAVSKVLIPKVTAENVMKKLANIEKQILPKTLPKRVDTAVTFKQIENRLNSQVRNALQQSEKIATRTRTSLRIDQMIRQLEKTALRLRLGQEITQRTRLRLRTIQIPDTRLRTTLRTRLIIPRIPKLPVIPRIPIISFGFPVERPRKKKKKRRKSAFDLAFFPGFTAKALGLKPIKVKESDIGKLLKTIQTGLEIRRPVQIIK